ncbi:MAG: hypothetical protein U1F49_20510 [Rubrivivax sp.]
MRNIALVVFATSAWAGGPGEQRFIGLFGALSEARCSALRHTLRRDIEWVRAGATFAWAARPTGVGPVDPGLVPPVVAIDLNEARDAAWKKPMDDLAHGCASAKATRREWTGLAVIALPCAVYAGWT